MGINIAIPMTVLSSELLFMLFPGLGIAINRDIADLPNYIYYTQIGFYCSGSHFECEHIFNAQ